jgi:8-oxo-dGTP pyrophosphatase MutT (NUDIX family)
MGMWKRLNTKKLLEHPRLDVVEDDVLLPSGETIQYLRFSKDSDGTSIICIKDGKILIEKEYSYPPDAWQYQFPGGAVDPNEDPEQTIWRELREETGFVAKDVEALGFFYLNNRRSAAKLHVFTTQEPTKEATTALEAEEDISVQWVTPAELEQMIRDGKMTSFSLLSSWSLYKARYGHLLS